MGQVWSKADFDGIRELGHHGGCGSVLAVTSQNVGADNILGTADDMVANLNTRPVSVSVDNAASTNCTDPLDRVRGFTSFHSEGAYFVFGDGSVHFVSNQIDQKAYQAMSTIAGSEVVSE